MKVLLIITCVLLVAPFVIWAVEWAGHRLLVATKRRQERVYPEEPEDGTQSGVDEIQQ